MTIAESLSTEGTVQLLPADPVAHALSLAHELDGVLEEISGDDPPFRPAIGMRA